MKTAPIDRRAVIAGLAGAAATLASPAWAQISLTDPSTVRTVQVMKPGDYLWAPEVAPDGPVIIVVSLARQRAFVYRNGVPIGISTVSTGKEGHATPTGVFTILQKRVDHKSNLYNSAPMPYMQRLTWDGIAIHAGNLPGYPASHGCIRLPMAFAQKLYGVTRLGLTVLITEEEAVPRIAPDPGLLTRTPPGKKPEGRGIWKPELSPQGPISIVLSAADRRMVVLRNGVEIGSAPISIDGPVTEPAAYTLQKVEGEAFHWLRIALPGQKGVAADVSAEDRARLHMPERFRRALAGILQPGATAVVTIDSLRQGDTGQALTVIAGEDDIPL
ncbi:hypothetical protein GCM10007897_11950 [Sphingobium jiangsuense]|uniref:L,D-TPase catalytic domain-containing protein n=1 Tax=Sphingobium jiangsuense TaxID=870476 RepID=A0A7W6BID4_9SPHN|nr:L,D-transpeptidase [Sphingobium jiangsuense]MBB3925596.1 hypothetical protein [Sphingobium jiangsuense]GLS99812.1 hypothetical protein GCM10007897_11950 [Sphingobium jiangsuense]